MNYPNAAYLRGLATKASQHIITGFGRVRTELKSDGTVVTEVDYSINQMVIDKIRRDFPLVTVVGEEASHIVPGSDYIVFVDPVDGTLAFTMGMPISSFCIAVVHRGQPIAAAIADPFQQRIWHADAGQGTWCNDKRVSVSNHQTLSGANLGVVYWATAEFYMHQVCAELMRRGARWMNPPTIAYLGGMTASGNLEATVFPARHVWETAAMHLIVTEAGGKATDIFGDQLVYDGVIATTRGHIISNGRFHDEIVAAIQAAQVSS